MEGRTLALTLPSEPDSVATARARVCDAMASDIAEQDLETLRLLISEVVTNAVRHGSPTAPLELNAHWNAQVRVEVSDQGEGFSPQPRLGALAEPGGFGLYLVGRLADRWGVDSNEGTTVWFVLERH